jgi:hypothetical protein
LQTQNPVKSKKVAEFLNFFFSFEVLLMSGLTHMKRPHDDFEKSAKPLHFHLELPMSHVVSLFLILTAALSERVSDELTFFVTRTG